MFVVPPELNELLDREQIDLGTLASIPPDIVAELRTHRFLVDRPIADSRYARQLGFFSLWEDDPTQAQARLKQARVSSWV
jgi:hypothetical protein